MADQTRSKSRRSASRQPVTHTTAAATMPSLSIARDKVCFIVVKVREFDVKDVPTIPDNASDPPDDAMVEVLEDRPDDDPVLQELAAFINAMNVDEQMDLVTLAWIGRGDGSLVDWDRLRGLAATEHNRRTTARYLLGMPLLGDFLAEGLAQFGYSCEEFANENFKL